jgi:ferritin-like metal-binding protein YciE
MSLESPRDLFVHELADMLSAEHIILGVLPELRKEALHPEVGQAFREHEAETKEHVKRLNQVFKLLGEKPEETTCHAAEGLKEEHQALHEERPTPEVLEMGNLGGAAKTEHYEIASYTAAAQMATDLGEPDVAALLKATLAEEKAMAKRVDSLAKQLGKEAKAAAKATAAA